MSLLFNKLKNPRLQQETVQETSQVSWYQIFPQFKHNYIVSPEGIQQQWTKKILFFPIVLYPQLSGHTNNSFFKVLLKTLIFLLCRVWISFQWVVVKGKIMITLEMNYRKINLLKVKGFFLGFNPKLIPQLEETESTQLMLVAMEIRAVRLGCLFRLSIIFKAWTYIEICITQTLGDLKKQLQEHIAVQLFTTSKAHLQQWWPIEKIQ